MARPDRYIDRQMGRQIDRQVDRQMSDPQQIIQEINSLATYSRPIYKSDLQVVRLISLVTSSGSQAITFVTVGPTWPGFD